MRRRSAEHLLVRGKAYLDVTRTGRASAMGRLATMLGDIQAAETPLERRVDRLGHQIARWVLLLAAALVAFGIVAEGLDRAPAIVIFAVALAVAAVPEGLPAVLTVALALGVERMARHRAVVRRLSAVEALGSVTVIATDKTGTLTESRMDVRSLDAPDVPRALRAVVLANDADVTTGAGDPLDLGLLRFATMHGVDVAQLRLEHPPVSERAIRQRVEVRPGHGAGTRTTGELPQGRAGGPHRPLHALGQRSRVLAREGRCIRARGIPGAGGRLGRRRHRRAIVAARARLVLGSATSGSAGRRRVALAAGIRVVMITGDHPATALAVAHQIGIPGVRVLTGEDLDEYQACRADETRSAK